MNFKNIIFVAMITLLSGCSIIFDSIKESGIESKIKKNGVYVRTENSKDNVYKYITSIRFLNTKKNNLKYSWSKVNSNEKIIDSSEFDSFYNVYCHDGKCKVGFANYTKNGIYDYSVRIDGDGNISSYSGGKIYVFKFRQDK